ncbi:MAG: helix-turn-helix transcriptional regulator [Gemmatimonadales bacterium]
MTADAQLARIVQLTAELSRAARQGEPEARLGDLAARHGVPAPQIAGDIRTLTLLGETDDADWLASLLVWQQEDRVSIESRGPFQRPLLLSPEERLAVQAALALDPDGAPLAARFAELWAAKPGAAVPVPAALEPQGFVSLFRAAVADRRRLAIEYASERNPAGERREIEPHQLASFRGRDYAVCWCPATADWRHFRLDRVVRAELLGGEPFVARADFRPVERFEDLFRPRETEAVTVRFSARVARWVKE